MQYCIYFIKELLAGMIRKWLVWRLFLAAFVVSGFVGAFAQAAPESNEPAVGGQANEEAPQDASASKEEGAAEPSATERSALPLAAETPIPSAKELLNGELRDWVILTDGRLLITKPVFPRPNTLEKMEQERLAILNDRSVRYSDEGRERLGDLNWLNIFLPSDPSSKDAADGRRSVAKEFRIDVDDIEKIVHHEGLMLRRAKLLIKEGKSPEAFELLLVVARRSPEWPGLASARTQMVLTDARRYLDEGQFDRALAMIASLYEDDPPATGAKKLLGQTADAMISKAIETKNGRKARFGLKRIRQIDSDHPAVSQWTDKLAEQARALRGQAEQAASQGEDARAAALIQRAAEVWPTLGGLQPVHARLTKEYQVLRVGVPQLAPKSPWALSTTAGRRVARLLHADLFELDQFTTLPSYRGVYLERWEPTDLGRRAHLELRSTLPSWTSRSALTASRLVDLLGDRFRPGSGAYDARFASIVAAVRLEGPYELEVEFSRIPKQIEAILAFGNPISPQLPDEVAKTFARFEETARTSTSVTYKRAQIRPAESPPLLDEIIEIAFGRYEEAIQALDRGVVRMLVNVPVWDIPRLRQDERYIVTPMAVPHTHLIQFHPESKPLQSAELRRALARSTFPRELLTLVAGEGTEDMGRLVTAPYPSTHLGYDSLVKPRPSDFSLAMVLVLAARQELGRDIPPLVFAIPPAEPARSAAKKLAAGWERIGLKIDVVEFQEISASSSWDLAYRVLSLPDPVQSLAPLITLDPAVKVASLADLPGWLRQRLLDLERSSDAATTQAILLDLHRLLAADVRCIPLFEIDQFIVSRGVIGGLPRRPVAVYQHAEHWRLPQDYPESAP